MIDFLQFEAISLTNSSTFICFIIYILKYHDTMSIICIEYKLFLNSYLIYNNL